MEIGETLLVHSRQEWRDWLAQHHRDYKEIWLIYYKKTSGKTGITYEESVEEALCFGWIDGTTKGIDQETYAGRFTPRRPKSPWSESNRRGPGACPCWGATCLLHEIPTGSRCHQDKHQAPTLPHIRPLSLQDPIRSSKFIRVRPQRSAKVIQK